MKRLVKFNLKDESGVGLQKEERDGENFIIVEVNELESQDGVTRTARSPERMYDEARLTFEKALDKIHSATESAVAKLRNLSEKPDEVTMEFGFNLSAEFGAIIASTSAEANYKVTITWSRKPDV